MRDGGAIDREEVRRSDVPFDRIPFDHDHCFLCGRVEPDSTEHIFPRWVLRRFDLWDQQLNLLNGTGIPYRRLTVPCCTGCNTGPLSQMEDEVGEAFGRGFAAVSALPRLRLFQWAGKILFGIMFKEMALSAERSRADAPTILSPEQIDEYYTVHNLLQTIRIPARFGGDPLYSVIVAPLHELDDRDFDFADSLDHQVVALRLGSVGVIASLSDGGLAEGHWSRVIAAMDGHPMHPIQFDEMLAHVANLRQRMTRSVKLMASVNTETGEDLYFHRLPSMSVAPPVRDAEPHELQAALRHFLHRWGPVTEQVWLDPHDIKTTIFAKEGHVALCDRDFNVQAVRSYR